MGSFSKVTGGAGVVILAGGTLLMASPGASMAAARRVVDVPCSSADLASAIAAADTPAGGMLRLAGNCTYDITTPATTNTGLPVITGDVTLVGGPATTIKRDSSAGAFRIFDVAAGGRLRVAGISILDGSTSGLGGGIQNAGTLVLSKVTMSGNKAANGGAIADLAGATATVARTLFNANAATGVGGGAILNAGRLTVTTSVFEANTAPINGGGINTQSNGVSVITRSTFEHNTSGSLGGGLSNMGATTLYRTLVRYNHASGGGGIATANSQVLLSDSIVGYNKPDNCSPQNTIAGCTD